jgi:hypothetical protein
MRSSLIETFQEKKPYSIDIVARVLHINDLTKLRKCCEELEQEGILQYDIVHKNMYILTPYGKNIQNNTLQGNKKLSIKVHVRKLMCVEFEKKKIDIKITEELILHTLTVVGNYKNIYQILYILKKETKTINICTLNSAIYRLLLNENLFKCGSLIFVL